MNIEEQRDAALSHCPKPQQAGLERAWQAKASPRQAIKLFCLSCMGYDRDEVLKCTAAACPLFAYRARRRLSSQRMAEGMRLAG
jgi:hypothetical protein